LARDPVMLDSGPLGLLARKNPKRDDAKKLAWLARNSSQIYISEVCDFEIRRSLLLHRLAESLEVLDQLAAGLKYDSITTEAMRLAAKLWADARGRGASTADPKRLDFDVILAAQAKLVNSKIVTLNAKHLSRYVDVIEWGAIPVP